MDELILMKLYTVEIYNLKMWIKEHNPEEKKSR